MKIDVLKECGEDLISREAGRKIRELIIENWDSPGGIEIAFGGRLIASVSFFDEAIGILLKRGQKSIEEIKGKLSFPDIKEADRRLLNDVIRTRLREQGIRKR